MATRPCCQVLGSPEQVGGGVAIPEQEHVLAQLLEGDTAGLRHPLLNLPDTLQHRQG